MSWSLILQEWTDFLIRWTHVIAGIAWIGSSFYFVHLDQSLKKRAGLPEGAGGDAWQVHGGGFYHMTKYLVAPPQLPEDVTWFKWESYATWLSGMGLLIVHYYMNATLYLIDPQVMALTPTVAIALSLGGLVIGWFAYDFMCKSPLGGNDAILLTTFFVFLVAAVFGFTKIFSGRGAFVELGALIGTVMVANVAHVIIPNQRKVVAALMKGEAPDPRLGAKGKQRSLHNNYLTLPVLFLMLSNHYPLAFASRYNWIIAALVLVIGGLIRHFYNTRHAGKGDLWWTWGAAGACMAAIIWLSAQGASGAYATAAPRDAQEAIKLAVAPHFSDVEEIVTQRCAMCHAKEPVWDGMASPPKGVLLDTPASILAHAQEIGKQAVWTNAMPPGGNITALPDSDRRILAAWLAAGAPGQ